MTNILQFPEKSTDDNQCLFDLLPLHTYIIDRGEINLFSVPLTYETVNTNVAGMLRFKLNRGSIYYIIHIHIFIIFFSAY